MKTRLISLGLLAFVAVASAKDGKVAVVRTYQADQVTSYLVQLDQMLGTTQVTLTLKQHVLKVNQDGTADCELQAGQIIRTTNGVAAEPTDSKPITARFDRSGALISAQGALMSMPFLAGGAYGLDAGLVQGQVVKFDRPDPTSTDVRLRGTVKLVSVADDVATVSITADRADVKTGPITHVEGTFTYKVKEGALTKSDLWLTDKRRPHLGQVHLISELQTP